MEINSHEWYEKVYHKPANMPDFEDYIKSAIGRGYFDRFKDMFEAFKKEADISKITNALEMGGHLGKTAYWLIQNMPGFYLDIMDFSMPAIEYLRSNLGKEANQIFKANVDRIGMPPGYYDLITCIDVSEHLPENTYFGMLKEISRLLKSSGWCIFKGSMAEHNTHINIRNPATIIKDCTGHMDFVKMLPHNFILFRRIK